MEPELQFDRNSELPCAAEAGPGSTVDVHSGRCVNGTARDQRVLFIKAPVSLDFSDDSVSPEAGEKMPEPKNEGDSRETMKLKVKLLKGGDFEVEINAAKRVRLRLRLELLLYRAIDGAPGCGGRCRSSRRPSRKPRT